MTNNNPFTQKYNKMKRIFDNCGSIMIKSATGLGNVSKTIAENNIGLVQAGQWLGEEILLMKVPLVYSAVAVNDVKLFRISVADF